MPNPIVRRRLLGSRNPIVASAFISSWKTDNAGTSNDNQITLPLVSGGTYDFTVDWGDGSEDDITAWDDAAKTHTYSSAGTYTVTITGTFEGFKFNNGGDKTKILTITDASALVLLDNAVFYGCSNATSFDLSGADTSSVTSMGSMFHNCSSLTSLDVTGFDTSSVTSMWSMFSSCSSLTSLDVTGFDTSSVASMGNMFHTCSSLTSLDVTGFNTSSVPSMFRMFQNCSSLTSLDVTGFDTPLVTDMRYMFYGCSGLTSVGVDQFDVTSVTDMTSMFGGVTLDTSNYNDILVAWEAQAVQDSVPFHGGSSTHSGAGTTARTALINDHSWTITDGGAA